MRVLLPHVIDTNGDGTEGWAILRGSTHPVEVVAFCWSHEAADEIYKALGKQAAGVFVAPAILSDDHR
jgi:hypothetical protein